MTADKQATPPVERETLLRCPFCGGRPGFDSEHDPDGGGVFYAIRCVDCNARSRQHYVSHGNDCPQFRSEVRADWNLRPPIPAGQTLSAQPVASKPAAWLCEFVREDGSTDTEVVLDDPECTRWADLPDRDGVSPYRVTPLFARLDGANAGEKP